MEEGAGKGKIQYEQIADMGHGLIIARVSINSMREQNINARIMKGEMQKQLTENIKQRGQLESLPLCALTENGTKIEIISGHHRIQSARDAGIKEVYVILDTSGLSRSKIAAKQIAHNAISGFDDMSALKEIAKMLDNVDDMIESFAGKDVLGEAEEELEKILSPTVEFDFKNIVFSFLPHQLKDLDKLVKALEVNSPSLVGVADFEQLNTFVDTLAKYQQFANVKNVGAAIHAMIRNTEQMFEDIGYSGDEEWVQMSTLFGSSAIPSDATDVIKEAIKKAEKEGTVTSKNRWQLIEYLCADYVAGS